MRLSLHIHKFSACKYTTNSSSGKIKSPTFWILMMLLVVFGSFLLTSETFFVTLRFITKNDRKQPLIFIINMENTRQHLEALRHVMESLGVDAVIVPGTDPHHSEYVNPHWKVRDWLCESKIPLILSLSCDPATHARDCARLISAGYTLKQMYLLDFYPNTSHIESLCVLELK